MRCTLIIRVISMDDPTARREFRETYGALVAQGDGETDFIVTVKPLERLSGLGEPKL